MDKNYNKQMAEYILTILNAKPLFVMSWGLDPRTITIVDLGIKFHVQGFKHKGFVQVVLNEGADLFEVTLISEDGKKLRTIDSVYLEDLVDVIDKAVEYTDDYEQRVAQEYGSQ